ncbi:radical SAM protein [uncultured Bacteroides sp.]|uniref:biotin synthase BioB n=1 Tax=uncultured Bacteroides sp. TaxID=162156 RepID=UPI00260E7283|nr:radical SAM protein [uncultured Bacteroides sp.]
MTTGHIISSLRQNEFTDAVLTEALELTGETQLQLFELAQQARHIAFPDDEVQVRSVIEISNVCRQKCRYCAIGGKEQKFNYTLDSNAISLLMEYLYNKGRRNILLQSGENVNDAFINDVVDAIDFVKQHHDDLRIILCMGDLSESQYQRLFNAGATDYILKFEASNRDLFSYCKPNDSLENRLECIKQLHKIGYRIGSGNIVGLPKQTLNDLVTDLQLIHELPLSMNSTTIFIPAENSAFANEPAGNPIHTLNMMALMRIMNPNRLMPTTSSLEKMIPDGQYLGLQAGANTVTIHDGTPEELQQFFPIYSAKRIRPQIEHFKDILERANLKTDKLS